MIFMVPVILGAAAVCGAVGLFKGTEGIGNVQKANAIGKNAQDRHLSAVSLLEKDWKEVNRIANVYGRLQVRCREKVVTRFINFIKRKGRSASQNEYEFLEGFGGVTLEQTKIFKMAVFQCEELSRDLVGIATAGFASGSGVVGVANTVGTIAVPQFFGLFTKQVAVSQLGLPGAAAWLGGGNLVLGGAVIGGVSIGPALAIGGFKLAEKGEKALTQAREYEAKINIAIEEINTSKEILLNLHKRIKEIGHLVYKLEGIALNCLNELEAKDSGAEIDVDEFQKVALLITAIIEISNSPITDEDGNLSPQVYAIKKKYQNKEGI